MGLAWANWAGDQRCAPAAVEEPASEAELIDAIRRAREEGRAIRVAGSGHSFTDIALTDGVMLKLGRMDRVLDADPASGRATVEAGIRLHELSLRLAERGLALENLGDIDLQNVAGAISTATHGTGLRFGNLSTQVVALRLVTAAGEVVDCSEETEPELFRAARVGLGALGVISRVTLRCTPAYTLHRVSEPRPLAETLERLDESAERHEHYEFFALPYAGVAMTVTTERSDSPPSPPPPIRAYLEDVVFENKLFGALCAVGSRFPRLIPPLNRGLSRLASRSERTDASHLVYANRRDVRFTEMEYAVPRAAGAEAARRVFDLIERRGFAVPFPIEVRFVAGDDAFLSPSYERETCYVAVHMYGGMEWEPYFREVEEIMDSYEGRPHWGKRHFQTAATLRERYPAWDRFQAVRTRLDPEGSFANAYTQRVLGPAGVRAGA